MASVLHPMPMPVRSRRRARVQSLRDLASSITPCLALAAPFAAVAIWAHLAGYQSASNLALEQRAEALIDGGSTLEGITTAYPPLPTILAAVLPGGTFTVSLLAALLIGVALYQLAHRMLHRGVSWPVAVVLMQSVVIVPVVWFQVVHDLAGLLGLAFIILAIDGFVRFIVRSDTLGGFRTGTMLAFGFLCDPSAIVHGIALIAVGPLLLADRREDSSALTASAAVLMFPIIAASTAWSYLLWRFGGGPLVSNEVVDGYERIASVGLADVDASIGIVTDVVLRSPLYVVIGLLLLAKSRTGALAYFLPVPTMFVALVMGFAYPPGLGFALLGLLALMTVPRPESRRVTGVLVVAACLQTLLAFGWSPDGGEFQLLLETIEV